MKDQDNQFGLKKPVIKPPLQKLVLKMSLLHVPETDIWYLAQPDKQIYIKIDPKDIGFPAELKKVQDERRVYEIELNKYNDKIKELNAEYAEQMKKEMDKEMAKAQAKAAENAQKKVKKGLLEKLRGD